MASDENEEGMELEAEHIFLLMKKEYRISRNNRAQWYFHHLNQVVSVPKAESMEYFKGEIEIVAAVPHETPNEWDWDTSHLYQYLITPSTVVTFLSHTYRLALCIDLSPSAATVDCVQGTTLLDEILTSFKNCVHGLARRFMVPGSQLLFCPKIYVTVIAHSPFLVSKGQQVLVSGWLLQQGNVTSLVDLVQQKLTSFEVRLSYWTNLVEVQRDAQLDVEEDCIVGCLFDTFAEKQAAVLSNNSASSSSTPAVTMMLPEMAFISILRYGMLALEMLPENSSAGIIVFTDGVFGTTDAGMLEVLLTQLRHNTIGCSFVQVGSRSCNPSSSEGFLPNNDLMDFLAATTFGACLAGPVEVELLGYEYRMNVYHQHFLTWGFHKSLFWPQSSSNSLSNMPNACFETSSLHRVQKKEIDYPVNCPLHSVLSCRLREGFTIREVLLDEEDTVEVQLSLPWRPSIQVEYTIRGQWPINQGTVRCEVSVQGPYDFLHDVTCRKVQSLHSRFRQMVVQSYWALLKNLSETDQLLAHLHSFSSNPAFYTVPDAVKNGVPLFYLSPTESSLVNTSSDFAYPQFEQFWRPVCVLDLGYWQRWLHSHQICVLLQHDRPMPKQMHVPSASGRYHTIQCRQAATALNAALRDFTTFVLLENHSYIDLVYTDRDKPPVSFYLVRLTHKPPCVLIRIAFLGGTAGSIRQKIVANLKKVIQSLVFPQRFLPQNQSPVAVSCCKVLRKPADKILLRYEKIPSDFSQVLPSHEPLTASSSNSGTNHNNNNVKRSSTTNAGPSPLGAVVATTQWSPLSSYLYHKRWIWSIQGSPGLALSLNSVARILSIITKMRLGEGFCFAHSASGILTFLLEVDMEGDDCQPVTVGTDEENERPMSSNNNSVCVVQYVLFPPHNTASYIVKDSVSEDEATEESDILDANDAQLEIVTECWVEPQAGVTVDLCKGLDYASLAESFYPLDLDCISSLVTFEHLNLMCRLQPSLQPVAFSSPAPPPPPLPQPPPRPASSAGRRRYDEEQRVLKDDTVTVVPFCFHLPRLLPKCSRAKLLFSTFVQEFGLPVRYGPTEADGVNQLLFELLTRQLDELGHREVTLQEEDCRQLLASLELESAAATTSDVYDNTNETEAQTDAGHTPREASSTPRSPRDWTGSSASNLSTLRSTLLASSSKADGSGTGHPISSSVGGNHVPMWRCFVKSLGSTHVIIVLLPASFHDLKLLKLNDERLLAPPSTQHVTRVAPDELPVDEENQEQEEGGKEATDDVEEAAGTTTTSSMQSMQSMSLGLTRTNSFVAQQRSPFESVTSRIRAGSLDAAPMSLDGPPHQLHHHSVGSADRRHLPTTRPSNPPPPQSLSSIGNASSSPFRPIDPSPTSVFASVTLPVYVFDCPLASLVGQLLTKGEASKEEFCRDHTFRDASSDSSEATEAASARRFEPDSNDSSSSPSESFSTLSHYCAIVEAAYCKSLGQALFTSLQLGRCIHSRDVEAALELCRETLLEIDVTPFLDNICGHLKDFRKQAVKESRRMANTKDKDKAESQQEDPLSHFPLNLLHEHKPCAKLRHLHRLIRVRFQEILCQSFHPVPSLSDYYVYRPMIAPQPVTTEQPMNGKSTTNDVSTSDVEIEFLRRRRRSQQQRGPMDREQDSMSVGFSSALSQDGRCDSVSTGGADGVDGENGESDIDDDDEDIDLEMGEDQGVDSDEMQEEPAVPLFLHLTATVRWKKDVASQSLRSLPTCLGDLISCLSTTSVIDLNDLKITLDFLFLTFRSEATDDGLPVPCAGPRTGNLRTTSFCSSSSGMLDVLGGFVLPPATPAMQVSQSELSQEDADADVDEDGCEQEAVIDGEESDRNKESPSLHHPQILHRAAESLARQLQHVPESQRRPVKAALSEIEWMLRDEIVAFLLDSCPITEATLSSVVQHVHSSPHRPSCRRKTVQLHFVLNPTESFRSFLVEFKKISIQDHQLREEGAFYYLTEKETGIKRRYNGSLDPPLGSNNLLHLQRMSSNENDTYTSTQVESRSRSLVAQSSSDSHCSTTAVTQVINDAPAQEVLEDNVMMESSTTLVSYSDPVASDDLEPGSPLKQSSSKRRFESGTSTSNPGRTSDSSSLVDSIRNTEDGYEGGSSGDSDDECEWLKDDPKMPPFWLVVRVKEEAVVTYFHCRHELARPDELLQWRHLHEDLLEQIEALGKRVNQQMLLQDLHDTRLCNQLLEPETNDDIWHQDEAAHVKPSPMSQYSGGGGGGCRRSHQNSASGFILEASLRLQPGTFECPQVWEAHFPLHPRLKTGPGKLGTSKGVQQLRFVLSAFSVNNRSNMFVYQETRAENKSVFYLRLHESSTCLVGHTKFSTTSDNVSVSFSTSTIRCLADEADGANLSSSRRASQWFLHSADEEVVTDGPSGGMSYKRSGSFGAASESDATSLNRFQSQTLVQQRCEDCIQLKVHGITEAGPAIRIDLVRVLQNKLDDAVLEVLHSLLSRNPACKLTQDDVHFIQKPHEPPHSLIRFAVQPPALPYLPSLAHYVRQNLLDSVVYTPKYMGNFAGHHFQDYSANPVASTDVYLYNRPQASGNRGIACIAMAVVDGRGNVLLQQQSLMHWPKPSVENNSGGIDPLLEELEQFVRCSPLDPPTPTNGSSSKRPGPLSMIEFRIWERGHINIDTLSEKLEAAICYALWDVVLEYRLLPYPLCSSLQSPGGPSGSTITSSMQSLPCSEPTTPVRLNEEELPADPRSRSVSFSGLPPQRSNSSATDETNKWKTRHASGTHPYSQANRPHSPILAVQDGPRHLSNSMPLGLAKQARLRGALAATAVSTSLSTLRGSTGPASPMEHYQQHRVCERSLSTTSSLAAVAAAASLISSATTHELSQFETGERGQLHTVYSTTIERWFHRGLDRGAPAVRLQKVNVLAPLTVPLLLKAFSHICSSATADMTIKIFSCTDDSGIFLPCPTASLCPKQASPDRSILTSRYILLGRNLNQWKESLTGEMQPGQLDNSQVMALKLQRNHQRFVSFLVQQEKQQEQMDNSEPSSMLLIPRQRLLWVTVDRERTEWTMWTYNFHKDSHESLAKQCISLIQWHNARWALLSSIVAQKLGLFHNQQCVMGPGSGGRMKHAHPTLRVNPFLAMGETETLIKMHLPPPSSREYATASGVDGQQRGGKASGQQQQHLSHLPHTAHLEAFRDSKPVRLLNQSPYGNQGDLVVRHGQQLIEKRHAERRDEMQRLLVLWQSRSSGSTVTVTEDVIQLFRQVARVIHYCFTPLLFLPKWRLQVARTRDPNMATLPTPPTMNDVPLKSRHESGNSMQSGRNSPAGGGSPPRQPRRPTDDHWHQSLCSAYLQEYVQYLHTLGFLQMEIKPIAAKRGPKSALKGQRIPGEDDRVRRVSLPTRAHLASPGNVSTTSETSSSAAAASASSVTTSNNNSNLLFFHKSHQGGIIVCEVAIQEPFFYTKVYALETSRLLMAGSGGLTHPTLAHIASAQAHYTDRFLNECDHIKVLLHLHSFTYDFHLRSLTSFVSGRQFLLKPAFHLVSFLDDFSKYYNKAPNFARNQVVVNTLSLKDAATPGEQLFDYLLNHERRYGFQVLRMVSSSADAINNDPPNTEYVLAKQWPFKALQRDSGDMKQMDDYDVTLLVAHDPPAPGDDPLRLALKYYVVLSSKREYYPRLIVEKKPGKFRTVSTATLIKAASAPPLDSTPTSSGTSRTIAEEQQEQETQQQINEPSPDPLSTGSQQQDAPLSVSNPEVSFIKRKESCVSLTAVPEENRTSPSSAAAVAAAAVAAAAAAVKHPAMRSPMFIRQEVINYLGYYTKHEQDMQSMINEQAAKAEELILTIVNQARVHCRRDTLWQRLQHQVTGGVLSHHHYQPQMTYTEFRELLTLSHSEPVSLSEPQQLVPLLAQPGSLYQGLAKLLLSRYPDTQRHFTSADGSAQYVVILNQRLPATAMMLSWDVHADRADLSTLCREVPVDSSETELHSIMDISHSRPVIMQAFVEEFINLCCFNMWTGLLG